MKVVKTVSENKKCICILRFYIDLKDYTIKSRYLLFTLKNAFKRIFFFYISKLTMVGNSKQDNNCEEDFNEFCKNFEFLVSLHNALHNALVRIILNIFIKRTSEINEYWISFQDTTVCYQCKGFYGRNFGGPMCGPCHNFFIDSYQRNYTNKRFRKRKQVLQRQPGQILETLSLKPRLTSISVAKNVTTNKQMLREILKQYLKKNVRKTKTSNKKSVDVSILPAEIVRKIFSYLDDSTMLTIGKVCKHLKQISESDSKQWEYFTKKRWPLFRLIETADGRTDWYKVRLKFILMMLIVTYLQI